MKNSLLVLVVFFVGCNLPYSNGVPENASVADELENVENCFYAAVFLLQREPESASEMPMFLEEAKQVVD